MRVVTLLFVRELPVPPAVLWPWVSEALRISAWAEVEIAPLSPGPGGGTTEAGATRTVRLEGLVPARMEERLVEVVPEERLVYSVYKGGGLRWHEGRVSLEPTDDGTRLTWQVDLEPVLPVGWVMGRMLERQFERGLLRLEAMVGG